MMRKVEIALAEAGIQPVMGLVDLKNKPEWFTTIVNPLTKARHSPNIIDHS